ncbi:MAG: hypothetical protein Q9227_002308 [Pyrenula ochraceoflavens]
MAVQTDESVREGTQDIIANGEGHKRKHSQTEFFSPQHQDKEKVLKLTSAKIDELASSPESFPIRALPPDLPHPLRENVNGLPSIPTASKPSPKGVAPVLQENTLGLQDGLVGSPMETSLRKEAFEPSISAVPEAPKTSRSAAKPRPFQVARALSTPSSVRKKNEPQPKAASKRVPPRLNLDDERSSYKTNPLLPPAPSPMPTSIPLPPISLATYLQLELSSDRPSPNFIHRSTTNVFPFESSRVKLERLQNFLFLPFQLEQILWFGALACLDSWLSSFTILPLRFLKAIAKLVRSWLVNIVREAQFVLGFVYSGSGRWWHRMQNRRASISSPPNEREDPAYGDDATSVASTTAHGLSTPLEKLGEREGKSGIRRFLRSKAHRRAKSVPSLLLPDDKADILKGFLIIFASLIIMPLDASRVYHWVRGQATIKLYVIYNVLEVSDRLLSALGQDVLECLFSRETLERKPDGRSKVLRPLWLFILALIYTVVHTTGLFYQVLTLNVAVNSYSNSLFTLLLSNQFVEIKSTVFKKFERENLFQLTCADVVERFQIWLALTIIALRNLIETSGFNFGFTLLNPNGSSFAPTNTSDSFSNVGNPPRSAASVLPQSFMIIPTLFSSLTTYAPSIGHVLGPFFVVLGSEMAVDWLKHCYVTKFNNTKPSIYGGFLDILSKDYYLNAFADQNLTKRLGLPVIPLSCLFIRAALQIYQMLLASWQPSPVPSFSTSLSNVHDFYTVDGDDAYTSDTSFMQSIVRVIRDIPVSLTSSSTYSFFVMVLVCLVAFFALVALKLVLGMVLLKYARGRYQRMKAREKQAEKQPVHHVEGGRRVGGWGVVEVDDDKRRVIYEDDPDGFRMLKEREVRDREKRDKAVDKALEGVMRYEMAAKRIW